MLASLGMLYLCQMCLLPGLIVLYFLGVRRLLQVLLMAMPVSLTVNYVLFHLLNAAGLRDQRTWLAVAGVEILVLLGIAWRHRRTTLQELFRPDWERLRQWTRENLIDNRAGRAQVAVLLLFGLSMLLSFAVLAFYRPGFETFVLGDDTGNWARWAREWAHDGTATTMWWYPQLGPVNRAIGYLFLGSTEIHLFNKMAMPLFALLSAAMLLDLELHYRDRRLLLAAGILGCFYWHFGGVFVSSGHMDIPVATMVLAAMYPLLLISQSPSRESARMGVVSAIAAAGAVWTKQTGLFVIFAVIGVWWWQRREHGLRLPVWMMATIGASGVLAAASFYVPQALRIAQGSDVSNVPELRSLTWRDPWLGSDLLGALHHFPALAGLVLGGAALSCAGGKYRALTVPLVVLSFLIWAFVFNYEVRNYIFAFPILALCLANACAVVWAKGGKTAGAAIVHSLWRLRTVSASGCIALLAVAAAVVFLRVPDSVVLNRQRNANLEQLTFGISNRILLDAAVFIAPGAKIATFHGPAIGIPEAHGVFVSAHHWPPTRSNFLRRITDGSCRFLFVEPGMLPENKWKVALKGREDVGAIGPLIDDAREKGLLKPVMTRYNATLYYYDPAEMRAEYGSGE